jgi:hypothetical protein
MLLLQIPRCKASMRDQGGARNMINLQDYVRAGDPTTDLKVLIRLSRHRNKAVRRRVAENKRCTMGILQSLAADSSTEVRMSVAHNPHVPEAVANQLAHDDSPAVRLSIAANPRFPLEILVRLAGDDNTHIRWRALKTIQLVNSTQGSQDIESLI